MNSLLFQKRDLKEASFDKQICSKSLARNLPLFSNIGKDDE